MESEQPLALLRSYTVMDQRHSTAPDQQGDTPTVAVVQLAVGRSNAVTRGFIWAGAAVLLAVVTVTVYDGLTFTSNGVSSAIVDFSIALIALPIPISTIITTWIAGRWFLLGLWPGSVGICACDDELVLRLGPFGTRRYDAARLDIRYPFELAEDEAGAGFEAFLPEQQQRDQLLPSVTHPRAHEAIDRAILRFAVGSEREIAKALGPVIRRWRAEPPGVCDAAGVLPL